MSRKLIGMALGALACVALAAGTADAQEKCKGAKQKAAGKAAGGALKCEAKGDSKGLDSATIDACEVKPDGALGTAYTKADTKFAPGCAGTASATAAAIETCEDNANNAVMNAGSPRTASKCDGKIVAAISKKVGGLLGCDAKATAKGLDPSACEMAVKTKFTAAMGKLGSATDCSIHPEPVSRGPTLRPWRTLPTTASRPSTVPSPVVERRQPPRFRAALARLS